ncbi:unnamed protein product [Withania somnifera]
MGSQKGLGLERVGMKTTQTTRRRGRKRRSRMGFVSNDNVVLQHQQDKVVKQRLLPGASQLPSHQLLLQTAKYIMHLRLHIHALQDLLLFINRSS